MPPLVGGPKRLYDLMVEEARFHDHVSFGSDGNHAKELGCCRRTVIRWRKQLESSGWIERCGWHNWHEKSADGFPIRTIRYRFPSRRVTRRPSGRETTGTRSGPRTFRNSGPGTRRTRAPHCGRRRHLMEQHPDVVTTGVQRASGEVTPFNAGDAIAAVADMYGLPMLPSWKARIGKDAKVLLESGFAPNVVVVAMLTAVQMGRPHMVQSFAVDFQNEAAGVALDWAGYRRRLHEVRTANSPGLQRIYNALEEAFKK